MFRDVSGGGGRKPARNVLGERLESCSFNPLTGFFRNGCCDTSGEDAGSHTVCVVLTADFLAFSKAKGNACPHLRRNMVSRASNRAIAGASARRAGRRRSRRARRPA